MTRATHAEWLPWPSHRRVLHAAVCCIRRCQFRDGRRMQPGRDGSAWIWRAWSGSPTANLTIGILGGELELFRNRQSPETTWPPWLKTRAIPYEITCNKSTSLGAQTCLENGERSSGKGIDAFEDVEKAFAHNVQHLFPYPIIVLLTAASPNLHGIISLMGKSLPAGIRN